MSWWGEERGAVPRWSGEHAEVKGGRGAPKATRPAPGRPPQRPGCPPEGLGDRVGCVTVLSLRPHSPWGRLWPPTPVCLSTPSPGPSPSLLLSLGEPRPSPQEALEAGGPSVSSAVQVPAVSPARSETEVTSARALSRGRCRRREAPTAGHGAASWVPARGAAGTPTLLRSSSPQQSLLQEPSGVGFQFCPTRDCVTS